MQGFSKVNDYIESFKHDLSNPDYLHQMPMKLENVALVLQNNTEMSHLFESSECRARPHQCMTSLKIQKFKEEVNYVQDIFQSIYRWFLAAIDHLDYHHSKTSNDTRHKRDTFPDYSQHDENDTKTLTPEETELVLDGIWELKQMNPDAYLKAKHIKRVDLLTWFLGWGIFSNS